jgi:type IV pilus assembly protein PilQ
MYRADLDRIKTLIREKLDIPLPQVKITARLEELNRESFFELGVQWGGATAKRDGSNVLVGQGFTGADSPGRPGIPPAPNTLGSPLINPNIASPPNLGSLLPVSSATGLPTGGNLVNMPLTNTAIGALGGFAFGIIGTNYNLNLVLQALEQQGKTRSVSRPEIATVDNSKASIVLGQEIPYATVSSAGTQVQFKDAVLRLEVTPTVVIEPNANRVKMLVVVEDNSRAGDISPAPGVTVPIINKRRAETQVLVKENETLAIGGIMQRIEIESIRKVPIFGDIPVLGWLFKVKRRDITPDRELVVFITPSLVAREGLASQTPPRR